MAELYDFQKKSVVQLLCGKYIITAGCGSGKNPMSMVWAYEKCIETGKKKILVITTASKARTTDHWDDMCAFCPYFSKTLSPSSFVVISWHKLKEWVNTNWKTLEDWVVVADEIQRSKGYSTGMGRAFLKIAKRNHDWAGFTGTPGDTWDAFATYFVATGLEKGKMSFMSKYANIQTCYGYPEIIGWRHEDVLQRMWARISYAPDISSIMNELPNETHKTIKFKQPTSYRRVLKFRESTDGKPLNTPGALVAELRRQCFTREKQEWVRDFVEDLESGCVFFYFYTKTGDILEEIIKKALPKNSKIWRIDGTHHDIPTANTIGQKDMVLCQWQSGSEALNLQFLHYWVAIELCYSYSMAIQGRGRIKRIGQKYPMFFYYLLTENTIEQDVLDILKKKGEFSEKNWCITRNLIK